jgi:hypothetical protein
MNSLSIQSGSQKFTITPTGIQFHSDLSFDEWNELGGKLAPIGKSIGFMLGDWINYGSKSHGEKYREAILETGIAYQTLANYASVARRVSPSNRELALGYEHHAAVAKLRSNEQHHWLGLAKQHKLGVRRLRKSIVAGRVLTEEELDEDPADRAVETHLVFVNGLMRWWKSETCKSPVTKWDKEWRKTVKADLRYIAEIYEQL